MKSPNLYSSVDIAAKIKAYAKSKNISLKVLLEKCELGSNTFSHMSHGRSLASDSLARIADYLDCSVDYLLGRTTIIKLPDAENKNSAPSKEETEILSSHEKQLITAYRKKPEMQPSIDKLLDIENSNNIGEDIARTLETVPLRTNKN